MQKVAVETFEAFEVGVAIEGSVQEYAMSFLKIFNNVKAHNELIRVTNDYGNEVYVVCVPEALEDTKEFLGNFGEVVYTEKVLCAAMLEEVNNNGDYWDYVVVPQID